VCVCVCVRACVRARVYARVQNSTSASGIFIYFQNVSFSTLGNKDTAIIMYTLLHQCLPSVYHLLTRGLPYSSDISCRLTASVCYSFRPPVWRLLCGCLGLWDYLSTLVTSQYMMKVRPQNEISKTIWHQSNAWGWFRHSVRIITYVTTTES
jgi:hypothetical protein